MLEVETAFASGDSRNGPCGVRGRSSEGKESSSGCSFLFEQPFGRALLPRRSFRLKNDATTTRGSIDAADEAGSPHVTSGGSVSETGDAVGHDGVAHDPVALEPLEQESADYFASFAQILGFPKSIGQIYGLVFMSMEPVHMDTVIDKLGISKGSASQGLNVLKGLGAVTAVRIEGDRREHFRADFDLSRIIHGFIEEKLNPRIRNGEQRIARMRELAEQLPESGEDRAEAEQRLHALEKWQRRGKRVLPIIRQFFRRS